MSTAEERLWDALRDQLNRIESKLDSKVNYRTFNDWKDEVNERIDEVESELRAIRDAAVSPEQVTKMVGDGLKDSEARGLTARDRYIRYGLAILSLGTFALLVYDRVHGH